MIFPSPTTMKTFISHVEMTDQFATSTLDASSSTLAYTKRKKILFYEQHGTAQMICPSRSFIKMTMLFIFLTFGMFYKNTCFIVEIPVRYCLCIRTQPRCIHFVGLQRVRGIWCLWEKISRYDVVVSD